MIRIRFVRANNRRSRLTSHSLAVPSAGHRSCVSGGNRPMWRVSLLVGLLSLLSLISLTACDTGPSGIPDGGSTDGDTPAMWASVGGANATGKGFLDWTDGTATPPMIRGPQGGQHVWVTVRMRGMSPKKLKMTVEMSRLDNGKVVKPGAVPVMATVKTPADFPSGFQSNSITAFVKCPCQVANRKLKVHLKLADLYGRTFETESVISPTWDGDCSLPPSSSCAEQ